MAKEQKETVKEQIKDNLPSDLKIDGVPNDISFDDIPVIPEQYIEKIYGQAYRFYNTGKFEDAAKLFRFLIIVDAQNPKHGMGLGATQQKMKNYEYAIDAYLQCSLLDPENPIPYFHSADCYLKMDNLGSAIINLELAIEHSASSPQFVKLQERAKLTVEALKKQLELSEENDTSKNTKKKKSQKVKGQKVLKNKNNK